MSVHDTEMHQRLTFRHRMGTIVTELEGWPCVYLQDLGVQVISLTDFRARLAQPPKGGIIAVPISPEYSAKVRFVPEIVSMKDDRQKALSLILANKCFDYSAQWLVLIDQPCYIFPSGGAIVLDDGRIVSESIYATANERTLERQIGNPELDFDSMPKFLAEATPWPALAVPVALYSRWSSVFSHAVAESLVQDSVLHRLGIADCINYTVPLTSRGCQNLVRDVAAGHGIRQVNCPTSVLKAPRALLCSLLYSFAIYGSDWRQFSAEQRAGTGSVQLAGVVTPGERVYVSRVGAAARPMRNEVELIALLRQRGFTIFQEQGLSFPEQVASFRNATLVVGPHGSGLLNAGFARPGATLLELRPLNRPPTEIPMVDTFVLRVTAGSGILYSPHISTNATDKDDWYANIPEILELVDGLLAIPRGA